MLLDYAFLQIFSEVGAHLGSSALSGNLGHVAVDHDVDEFLEGRLVGIPS